MSIDKKLKNSRAFTIVELVIIIAVVAILAAVLIPTFINAVNMASESADTVLVKNLNTALAIDETTNGKAETCHDALQAVSEYGYTVEKLTPTSKGDLLWEQSSNRFALVDADGNMIYGDSSTTADVKTTPSNFWYIMNKNYADAAAGTAKALAESSAGVFSARTASVFESAVTNGNFAEAGIEYSVYLATDISGAVTVSAGVDVGNNSGLAIQSSNESGNPVDIIIRVNGGTLTVDNPNATVYLYGILDVPEITASDLYLGSGTRVTYFDDANITGTVEKAADAEIVIDAGSEDSLLGDITGKTVKLLAANGGAFNNSTEDTIVIIPYGTEVIEANAFMNVKQISAVLIPPTVTEISANAFKACSNLETVVILSSDITKIGLNAFYQTPKLEAIHLSMDMATLCGLDRIGIENTKLYLNGELVEDVVVPDSVESYNGVFAEYPYLKSIVFMNPDTEFNGDALFKNCTGLEKAVLPANLESIGYNMFNGCSSLSSITIPNNVTIIYDYAFCGTGIVEITIPASVKEIWKNVFENCENLTSITFAKPDGWRVYGFGDRTGTEKDLSDPFNNVALFKQYSPSSSSLRYTWRNLT